MNCRKVSHSISAYADGELPGMEHRAVHEHLKMCESCRDDYEGILETKRLFGAMPMPSPRSEFVQIVMQRIREEEVISPRHVGFWRTLEERFRLHPTMPQGAIVAASLAVFGVLLMGQKLNRPELTLLSSADEALEAAPATMVFSEQSATSFSPMRMLLSQKQHTLSAPHPPAFHWETSQNNLSRSFLQQVSLGRAN